jgi:succinyl-CoA synthetase beta subunit
VKLHEYQAKDIFRQHRLPVPDGRVVSSADEAYAAAQAIGNGRLAVKAQVQAGGRGKGGGIRVVESAEAVREAAAEILGMRLVTAQTGGGGRPVHKVLVEKAVDIAQELYLGVTLDRTAGRPTILASREGGVEIEQMAARSPEAIVREAVDPRIGLRAFQARRLATVAPGAARTVGDVVTKLYEVYAACDASLAEINPLTVTVQGEVVALDAKLELDDNALYRHPDLAALRDIEEEEPQEVRASEAGFSYVKMDGAVGCLVNGAGLAMATMDMVKFAGQAPANFLDIGGGARAERVVEAMRILLSDPAVTVVLINIFGGIVRCDQVARGVVDGLRELGGSVPIVVRLVGTNAEEGGEILRASGLNFRVATELADAAKLVIAALGEVAA